MLLDLDELLLQCRSLRARQYLAEAVVTYKAGANRSCIVATWNAVVFDFVDKLRELDLGGDLKAREKLDEIDVIRRRSDVGASLQFERSILDLSTAEFEFLTPLQKSDLERLREDRNRCAHPTMQSEDEPFIPSTELARYHLSSAVQYMLSQPPVQGKAVLDQLLSEIASEYFPRNQRLATAHFRDGPLARARETLVRNLVIVVLKRILLENLGETKGQQVNVALLAIHELYPAVVESTLRERLPDLARKLEDNELDRLLRLAHSMPITVAFLGEANMMRLNQFVASPPLDGAGDVVRMALQNESLRKSALDGVQRLSDEELARQIESSPLPQLLDEAVSRFITSDAFASAIERGKALILPFVSELDESQKERIRESYLDNAQVLGSFVAPRIIRALLEREDIGDQVPDNWANFHRRLTRADALTRSTEILSAIEARFPSLRLQ